MAAPAEDEEGGAVAQADSLLGFAKKNQGVKAKVLSPKGTLGILLLGFEKIKTDP